MINLAEVVNDPDFAQSFVITRSQGGAFKAGKWQDATTTVQGYGVIQPATAEELNQVPEGDRVNEVKSFHSSSPLYETHTSGGDDPNARISDTIAWSGQNYKLVKVFQWQDFGYYKALGVRMSGA